ncbi:hypothetical protein [Methylobacterium sp. GC_Met_2]|uniref:GHMP family kinase ATP-binding protein n=1 Tax=Methylobacterium sp. GC_Met_2 TaxID=2937376 RepID=UPI00226B0EF6|nr:hypothetical protein [Methylobacterium sp. GC_Met_2]
MIITRTPFRVSLFGGGTDYPAWCNEHGGAVLGFAIDRYCYITLRHLPPFFEYKHRVVYSRIETVQDASEIGHPVVRAALGEFDFREGLEIHHDGDLPARSGLGSSSSFTVGLLNALHALRGQSCTKDQLAKEAIHVEQRLLAENVGLQDQVWAAHGGFNRIEFGADRFTVMPLIVPRARLENLMSHLVLYFTGFSRFSSDVAKESIRAIPSKHQELSTMYEMVSEAQSIICNLNTPISEVGHLLHEGWKLKRSLSASVATPAIDDIYAAGRDAGAIGGKLLGAGGGGFLLFFVEPEKREALRARLSNLIEVDIDVDFDGSRVMLFEPDGFRSRVKGRSWAA